MAKGKHEISVFFLSNAYCGSEECLKELEYADMKRFTRIPVFMESFVDNAETYRKKQISTLCDKKMQEWKGFEVAKSTVERLTFRLQGVTGPLDLTRNFTCNECRGKRDTICPRCSSCELMVQLLCSSR